MRTKISTRDAWSKFATTIETPGPDRAVLFECEAKISACGDADDVRQTCDLYRRVPVGCRAVAELAPSVRADPPHSLIGFEHEQVIATGCNRRDIRNSVQLQRRRVRTEVIGNKRLARA